MKTKQIYQNAIKWMRLKEIAERLLKDMMTDDDGCVPEVPEVNIMCATDLPPDLRAAVRPEFDATGKRVINIALNLLYNKTLEDVIDSIAHELAHEMISAAGDDHGKRFEAMMRRVARKMKKAYLAKEQPCSE